MENIYKKELDNFISLIDKAKIIKYDSILLYGSYVNKDLFEPGLSDIDIIIMSNNFLELNLEQICNRLINLGIDFKEKKPTIIEDNLCKRIEFYYNNPVIPIDVTMCGRLIPLKDIMIKDAWYDSIESLIGAVYLYSKTIYGQIPDYSIFLREFYPFYDNDLRDKRLDILRKRLLESNRRLELLLSKGDKNILDFIIKYRKYFLKYLYIYYKKYYISPDKHTYYQLDKYLQLSDFEKNALCLLNGNIFDCASNYLEVSNAYLNMDNEKKLKR